MCVFLSESLGDVVDLTDDMQTSTFESVDVVANVVACFSYPAF